VAISLGSSRRWVTKLWPPEYFADVANRLARELGVRVVLVGRQGGDQRTEEFLRRARCKPINALGKTTIPRLATLMERCNVVVTADSAPLHVAASVNTPLVALFGPTDPARHLAPVGRHIILRKDFRCSPCYQTRCRRDYKCMKSIKPDEVYEAGTELLEAKSEKRKAKNQTVFRT
jgi:ADP-heptose:LPS heptosyltransferase